jgi:diguanylate cyclase (GGDEF)-like protein
MRLGNLFEPGQHRKSFLVAFIVGLLYLLASVIWILFSDHVAARLASSQEQLQLIQQYKGLGFVAVMTLLIAWLVYKVHHRGVIMENAMQHIRTDLVTGLANRVVAEEFINNRLQSLGYSIEHCGLILFNVREFKRINLSIGRSGGDSLLYQIAQRIRKIARPTDLVARLENDRLLIVLGSLTSQQEALTVGNKIQQSFREPVKVNGLEVQVELQGVAAMAPENGRTAFELLDACERALYRSKAHKMETYVELVSKEDLESKAGHLALEAELRRAIREKKFTIALQPQVDLDSFKLAGAEALIRWQTPERGYIPPAEFIPLAESLGLVPEITEQVLDMVCRSIDGWIQRGLPEIRVSVNLSGIDLKSGRILEVVSGSLSRHRIPGRLITLEITETWLMEDPNLALGLIHRLRDLGPRLAIDDFGTGYSALSQLIDFPFDFVKFDRPFVSGVDNSPKKAKVLAAIQRMSATLGAQTVAEGVETIGELAVAEELGINEVQGYLFSKPVPLSAFETAFLNPQQSPFEDVRLKLEKIKADNPNRAIRIKRSIT